MFGSGAIYWTPGGLPFVTGAWARIVGRKAARPYIELRMRIEGMIEEFDAFCSVVEEEFRRSPG